MGRLAEFKQGVFPNLSPFLWQTNDGIFSGPRGAYQQYTVSSAASDALQHP